MMDREDAKDLTLSILVIVVALLVLDCLWLHLKCASQNEALQAQASQIAALEAQVTSETKASIREKAKDFGEKVKSAAEAGYKAAKEKFNKQ